MEKRDWWLVFYRPLSGPAVAVDFKRAIASEGEPEQRGEGNIRTVLCFNRTMEEMQLIKMGAAFGLEARR